jgi:hypothetical protein
LRTKGVIRNAPLTLFVNIKKTNFGVKTLDTFIQKRPVGAVSSSIDTVILVLPAYAVKHNNFCRRDIKTAKELLK